MVAYYRYLIYNALHDDAHATYWLVESACNDIKTATMGQASLWTLADNLMNKGYLSYSHHYVTLAWRYAVLITAAVNSLGCYLWDLHYDRSSFSFHLELSQHLSEDALSSFCSQMPLVADYDGEGSHGSVFTLYL